MRLSEVTAAEPMVIAMLRLLLRKQVPVTFRSPMKVRGVPEFGGKLEDMDEWAEGRINDVAPHRGNPGFSLLYHEFGGRNPNKNEMSTSMLDSEIAAATLEKQPDGSFRLNLPNHTDFPPPKKSRKSKKD